MIHFFILTVCSFMATPSYAELMQCDDARRCRLVCYFPSGSARTDHVYLENGVTVGRVRVEVIGAANLLYTPQRIARSRTMPIHQPPESFILPKAYGYRLLPIADSCREQTRSRAIVLVGD